MSYDPSNWYWIVAGGPQVFSSARAAYFDQTDKNYQAWVAAGNIATNIESESALWDVLSDAYPAGIPAGNSTAQDQLKSGLIDRCDVVAFKILFNHENRIRALEGKQAVTKAQFVTAIKSII